MMTILLTSGVLFQARFLVMLLVSICPLQGQCDMGALLGYGRTTGKQIGA